MQVKGCEFMYCDECGNKINENAAFCNGCGTQFEDDELEAELRAVEEADEFEEALSHRLFNVTKLRLYTIAILGLASIAWLVSAIAFDGSTFGAIISIALLLINASIYFVPNFIADYGSRRTFDPMLITKGNMIVSFVNIGVAFIQVLIGDGHILGLIVIRIPDFLLLTQVKMIYNLAGRVTPSSVHKTEYLPKREAKSDKAFGSQSSRNEDTNVIHDVVSNPAPVAANTDTTSGGNVYKVGQKVFARWNNGEVYFPGIVSAVNGDQLDISFLDGDKGTAPIVDVLELHKAFTTLKLHGNWQNGGEWYTGKITKSEPLTMQYDYGEVEEVKLEQLQGVL